MKSDDLKNLTFEDAMSGLESIVRELETGQIKLDDAVEAYEKATKLKKFCEEKLKNAELKVEKIEQDKDGNLTVSSLDEKDMADE